MTIFLVVIQPDDNAESREHYLVKMTGKQADALELDIQDAYENGAIHWFSVLNTQQATADHLRKLWGLGEFERPAD